MINNNSANNLQIVLFKNREIRRAIYNNEWWFVVNDVVEMLTDTPNVSDYLKKFRLRDKELNKGWGQIVTPLSVPTAGGPQMLNCAMPERNLKKSLDVQ